jgi:hypothetical protein
VAFELTGMLVAATLFGCLVGVQEIGHRLALVRLRKAGGEAPATGVVDGAVFALLGLLIAFTFSSAASRFQERRELVVEEANAIGTAYLRLDLLPAAAQPALREAFRRYLDARLAGYRALPDIAAARNEAARAQTIQGEIWNLALAASAGTQPARMLLTPALNDMFDIASTRMAAMQMHPPGVIFGLLFALALLSAVLAGYSAAGKPRDWIRILVFASTLAGAVYVILDLEYPRLGLIRVDSFDHVLIDVRQSMK